MYFRWLYIESRSILWKKFNDKLVKCALSSRVVLNLLQLFFKMTLPGKIPQIFIFTFTIILRYGFDCASAEITFKCTSIIRENRVKEKNVIDKKTPRSTYVVKHEQNSDINYITVMDSKPVSIASTAAGSNSIITFKKIQFRGMI